MTKYVSTYCSSISNILMTLFHLNSIGELSDDDFNESFNVYRFVSNAYLNSMVDISKGKDSNEISEVKVLCNLLNDEMDNIKKILSKIYSVINFNGSEKIH